MFLIFKETTSWKQYHYFDMVMFLSFYTAAIIQDFIDYVTFSVSLFFNMFLIFKETTSWKQYHYFDMVMFLSF